MVHGSSRAHHGTVIAATTPSAQNTVRVLVVDDHPALRAGLEGLLSNEPGVECVGALDGSDGLLAAVHDLRPDVVVLDYALGADDGLSTCFRLKQQPDPPAVPAAIAQADATVSKSAPIDQLLGAVHGAAAGTRLRRQHDPELIQAASARLLTEDLPIATMLLGATAVGDIADVLETTATDVRNRALRIIGRLQASDVTDTGTERDGSADWFPGPQTLPEARRRARRSGVSTAA
jgi:DNA-binding NarL/FixJ family response regulator